jgi:hypothetical protein
MKEAPKVYAALDTPGQKGHILMSSKDTVTLEDGSQVATYEDVLPHLLHQHTMNAAHTPTAAEAAAAAAAVATTDGGGSSGGSGSGGGGGSVATNSLLEFGSFDMAVDEYFGKLEEQKLAVAADSAENAIKSKVEKIRGDQRARLEALEAAEALAMRRAELLQKRADDVDKVILVLTSAMDNGVGWDELTDYVTAQQECGNPIALMVHALRLETSTVVVVLEDDEAPESAPAVAVDIDLTKVMMWK